MTPRHTDVEHQMERISNIFQNAVYISAEQAQDIPGYLAHVDAEFRSVAYEGIAMRAVIKDFGKGTFQAWESLKQITHDSYLPHVYLGVGWGVAKLKLSSLSFLEKAKSVMLFRVADGHGFYDGMFRSSQTNQAQERPSVITQQYFKAYDQGVGRSLWYINKGDSSKVQQQIASFESTRQADLWRGVGLACSFVGGCSVKILRQLYEMAGRHHIQLGVGAVLVVRARILNETLTADAEQACRMWCNVLPEHVIRIADDPQNLIVGPGDDYRNWLLKIESELSKALTIAPVFYFE